LGAANQQESGGGFRKSWSKKQLIQYGRLRSPKRLGEGGDRRWLKKGSKFWLEKKRKEGADGFGKSNEERHRRLNAADFRRGGG